MNKIDNAIILAAGKGERFVPMTYEKHKGMLRVCGDILIERQIEQLHERNITDITIVVGYMKEQFEYLRDKYGVELVYNPEFAQTNTTASLHLVREKLGSTYILVSDNYLVENIFNEYEDKSWYSCKFFQGETDEWIISRSGENGEIEEVTIGGENDYAMLGPIYFSPEFSRAFKPVLEDYYARPESADYYWEHVYIREIANLPPLHIRDTTGMVQEFESLEELREYDRTYYHQTDNKVMEMIAKILNVSQGDVYGIQPIKTGMSNHSFKFYVGENAYVFRVPGEGSNSFVNRGIEYEAYLRLAEYRITDEPLFLDPKSGEKMAVFLTGGRNADAYNDSDLRLSMQSLRTMHGKSVRLSADYDIQGKTERYLTLDGGVNAMHLPDFDAVSMKMANLFEAKTRLGIRETLCHGDFAHVNVMIMPEDTAKIIDFEHCGNGDPIMDVAFYAIFAEFDERRMELALQYYLGRTPAPQEVFRLHLYAALGGFLWTVWALCKQDEPDDYVNKMYDYAKEYYAKCTRHPVWDELFKERLMASGG